MEGLSALSFVISRINVTTYFFSSSVRSGFIIAAQYGSFLMIRAFVPLLYLIAFSKEFWNLEWF
jgi:hypothetical protein